MKIFNTLFFCIALVLGLSAQVSEKAFTMSLGSQNGYLIDLDGAKDKDVEKLWKKYLKEHGKVEKNKKAKEHYMTAVRIPMISRAGNVDLYSKIEKGTNRSTLYVWVDNGGTFASSDETPDVSEGIETFITDFSYIVQKEVIKKELEDQEDKLKDLNKDMSKLEKKNKGYHEDIEKANKKIVEAEENIEKNLVEQDNKTVEIDQQQKVVEEIIDRLNAVGRE